MLVRAPAGPRRSGTAAVEMAIVFNLIVVPTLIGVLEVGRLVQIQQVVANAAREGARLGAQAVTITTSGTRTEIKTNTGSPSVKSTVYQYLQGAGLTALSESDVTVTWAYLTPRSDGVTAIEPYQGEKLQKFRVTVTVQYEKLKWINFGFVNTSTVSFAVDWRILLDDKFNLNVSMPVPDTTAGTW